MEKRVAYLSLTNLRTSAETLSLIERADVAIPWAGTSLVAKLLRIGESSSRLSGRPGIAEGFRQESWESEPRAAEMESLVVRII